MKLPYICINGQGLVICHSLGRPDGIERPISWDDLVNGKKADKDDMIRYGYEAWKGRKLSYHAAMVNSRDFTEPLLSHIAGAIKQEVAYFVVGHTHYRSGDIQVAGDKRIITLCSSSQASPDAGHYMHNEMHIKRKARIPAENLPDGDALPCYLSYKAGEGGGSLKFHFI